MPVGVRVCLAAVGVFLHGIASAHAAPAPEEPGWAVRCVADGYGSLVNGIADDPVSSDLIHTESWSGAVYRVELFSGAKRVLHRSTDLLYDELAYDPAGRIIYVGGTRQTTLRKLDESGVLLNRRNRPDRRRKAGRWRYGPTGSPRASGASRRAAASSRR